MLWEEKKTRDKCGTEKIKTKQYNEVRGKGRKRCQKNKQLREGGETSNWKHRKNIKSVGQSHQTPRKNSKTREGRKAGKAPCLGGTVKKGKP